MEVTKDKTFKLTKYSHGAGCGCKISPKVLDSILKTEKHYPANANLLVGNNSRDDAAVYDMGNGEAVISTTDFFMPIVDDPFDFGRIASVNAISDVYAMGGTPLVAIAVLGWPIDKLPAEVAAQVIEGARVICQEAGIPLAGGHSIDSPEPIFGLAVTGKVKKEYLKQNNTAVPGCKLFLTKPLGVGILSTAQKKGILKAEHNTIARDSMVKLNNIGERFAKLKGITAMTDVTGFGLMGHLCEVCEGSTVSAEVYANKVPVIKEAETYISLNCIPGGTLRNWDSYGHKIVNISDFQKNILCDPQTSGGLLVAVLPESEDEFLSVAKSEGMELQCIGKITERKHVLISIN